MAKFSDLPDDIIIDIWGYMYAPEDVESFALVSKGIYSLSTPIVREHNHLKRQFSKMSVEKHRTEEASTPSELLEKILLNPRIALYIRELQIRSFGCCLNTPDAPFISYPEDTTAAFVNAIQNSPLIAPSKIHHWIREVRKGNDGRILGLVVMRLTKLQKLGLRGYYSDSSHCLLETLARMEESAGNQSHIPGLSKVPHINDLEFVDCEIDSATISRLSLSRKKMKAFSYYGTFVPAFEPVQVCNDWLESSQYSLQKLCLHADGAGRSPMGNITRFQLLADLEVDFIPLLGGEDETCGVLADVLPTSIRRVTLFWDKTITVAAISKVVLEMIKSKSQNLPKLEALTFKFDSVFRYYLQDHIEQTTKLQEMSAKVGVRMSAMADSERY